MVQCGFVRTTPLSTPAVGLLKDKQDTSVNEADVGFVALGIPTSDCYQTDDV